MDITLDRAGHPSHCVVISGLFFPEVEPQLTNEIELQFPAENLCFILYFRIRKTLKCTSQMSNVWGG